MLAYIFMIVSGVSLLISVWAILTRRKAALPVNLLERPADALSEALRELHEKSKPSGGRLHLHDVEEILIRRMR